MKIAPLLGTARHRAPNLDSMSFIAPANKRHAVRGARGVVRACPPFSLSVAYAWPSRRALTRRSRRVSSQRATATSRSADVAQWVAIILVGVLVACCVSLLHNIAEVLQKFKHHHVRDARQKHGLLASWLFETAFGCVFIVGAICCVLLVPHSKGSGLPQLLAYLNGCKLRGFTSWKVLSAKLIGTSFSLAAGLCVGPEGPMIHMGACVGKQLLRALYYLGEGTNLFAAFAHLRNDLDQRDFIAIGAGAGISAAFFAPM